MLAPEDEQSSARSAIFLLNHQAMEIEQDHSTSLIAKRANSR